MNALSSGSHVIVVLFLLKYAITALLSTSNIDSFARKLLDSKSSHMTKHMVFQSFAISCHCWVLFYGIDFFLFSWQFILLVLWLSFVLKMLITSLWYRWKQKHYVIPRLIILM